MKLRPHIFLNSRIDVNKEDIRRFLQVYYPIYSLPIAFTERSSEPYEELEKNISRLLEKTELKKREEVYEILGISHAKEIGDKVVDYLISISHIEETEDGLYLKDLGRSSLEENYKIKEEHSERLMYFDALSLKPLPSKYYKSKNIELLSSGKVQSLKKANIIDSWRDFSQKELQKILDYKKEERRDHNIPGETVNLRLSEKLFEKALDKTSIPKGVIYYLPLYLVAAEDKETFKLNFRAKDYASLNIYAYNGTSGKKCEFFTSCIRENSQQLEYILKPLLENFDPLVDENLKIWGKQLAEFYDEELLNQEDWLKEKKIGVNNFDNNPELNIDEDDVAKLIETNNDRAIKDIAHQNIIPLKDRNYHGLFVKLKETDKAKERAINHVLREKENSLVAKSYSQQKIDDEVEKLEKRLYNIQENKSEAKS
ncbi:hypothetical protein [Natranaerofaba carboxydovora]|uniref:hypothetical protein n=1 Tax=Natranaerofaba carboxydovora TaxID=2742683 RepID=UPI001F13DF40|nr:hypothetical protein [Natranaerofaba carboxydovora]UMZ73027.1 hypothetical protein ACONDI_00571 [Natranaerofaba carboxydovora]